MGHPSEVLRKIAVDRKHGRKETGDGSDIEPQSRFAKDASYLADRLSLEAAFLFGAIISIIAFTGILLFLPSMPVTEKMSFRSQLGILRKPALWLNIAAR
jgi:hypothetical protein